MMRPMLTTELIRERERDLHEGVEARRRDREAIEVRHVCAPPPDPLPPPTPVSARSPERSEAA